MALEFIRVGQRVLSGLSKINVILGKNGCGKSYLLRQIDQTTIPNISSKRYISPERGGQLTYQPNVLQTMQTNPQWLGQQRRRNTSHDYRQTSVALFAAAELNHLRAIEKAYNEDRKDVEPFAKNLDLINSLLDRVKIIRDGIHFFQVMDKADNIVNGENLSSGETELISLAMDIISFCISTVENECGLLLLDEPDAHLHPDLQHRLAEFIYDIVSSNNVQAIITTHNTSFMSGISGGKQLKFAFMKGFEHHIGFIEPFDEFKKILPIFGTHPLSNAFNNKKLLLVEGEDDTRIWEQAYRSSEGKINIHPCDTGGLPNLPKYETLANDIMSTIYDDATAFSLRDRDEDSDNLDDKGKLIRLQLSCRTAENLMLSDCVLSNAGLNWDRFKEALEKWQTGANGHQYLAQVTDFINQGYNRKSHNIKNVRNIFAGLISKTPWEVAVGKAIANINSIDEVARENSIANYLGIKVCRNLLNLE